MAKSEHNQDKLDAVYQWLVEELQHVRDTLLAELRMSSAQIGALHSTLKNETAQNVAAVSQEIRYSYRQNQTIYDGLAAMMNNEVGDRLNAMDEKLATLDQFQGFLDELNELKQCYTTLQVLNESIHSLFADELNPKLDAISAKQPMLDQISETLDALNEKLISEDYETLAAVIAQKTEESVANYSEQVLNALAVMPESVDYERIVDDVGDKVLEILNGIQADSKPVSTEAKVDYDRIIYGAAEKVVESLPLPEKVDYNRISASMSAIDTDVLANTVASKLPAAPEINYEYLADLVAQRVALPAIPEMDYDRLADLVVAKMPAPTAPEIDYDRLSDMVVEKMVGTTEQSSEMFLDEDGINALAEKLAAKLAKPEETESEVFLDENGINTIAEKLAEKLAPESIDYDKVCQAAMSMQIVPDPVDYDRIAEIVEHKLANEEPTYDLVIDQEGISAIAKGVSEEICRACESCVIEQEVLPAEESEKPVEETAVEELETAEEVAETPIEETEELMEETTGEPIEEIEETEEVEEVEETPVEDVKETVDDSILKAEQASLKEELAATVAEYQEVGNDLVDAETGLVIRLKRSFTAKMKQSEDKVKAYYSDLKNELVSYKKINSNVSWHGDRFNFGRDTVAKININGKTLCFYLALDPQDPEYKETVYHQKDVGGQKAYESTPFMVKVKSDAAVKKALRLVGYLADKLGTEKEEGFQAVDYAEEYTYQSTKQLFDEGYIKATKEKKVDFDF